MPSPCPTVSPKNPAHLYEVISLQCLRKRNTAANVLKGITGQDFIPDGCLYYLLKCKVNLLARPRVFHLLVDGKLEVRVFRVADSDIILACRDG